MADKSTYQVPQEIRSAVRANTPTIKYRGTAKIADSAVLAPSCQITGDVELGEDCVVFANAVIRADSDKVVIGPETNVQECCVLHENNGNPLVVGAHCTLGHGCILHSCTLGDNTMVGMNAVVLDGAVLGKNCAVAAGAVVLSSMVAPDNSLIAGVPAKVVKTMDQTQVDKVSTETAEINLCEGARMLAEGLMLHPTPELLKKIGAL